MIITLEVNYYCCIFDGEIEFEAGDNRVMASPTENIYALPIAKEAIEYAVGVDSPGHPGQYATAVDYAVPVGTEVRVPLDGEVITVIDGHTEHGPSREFASKVNYIQIQHIHGEISDLMHLGAGSILVQEGDNVKTGQVVARTGLSGYMTAPHLHWFVYRLSDNTEGFEGLQIQLKDEVE